MATLEAVYWQAITPDMRYLLLVPLSWPEVKAFFVAQAQALGRIWFQD